MSLTDIKNSIRNVPDYPKPGIQFKDITTAMRNPAVFKEIIDMMTSHFAKQKIDYVVGIDARGFGVYVKRIMIRRIAGIETVRGPNERIPNKSVPADSLDFSSANCAICRRSRS